MQIRSRELITSTVTICNIILKYYQCLVLYFFIVHVCIFTLFIVHVLMIFIVHVCFFIDGPDEPSVFLNPSKSSFYVGEDLTLSCSADSNPPSKCTWTFQSTKHFFGIKDILCTKKSIGSTLMLQNVQINCSGIYTCTASNGLGRRVKM